MISINIIVKDDRRIENLLNKLNEIPKPEKKEIIVIDASKKETLLDIKKKFPKVRWFYYENKTGKKITIPEQRNMGIKKSKGEIIVFIDADCIPDKRWLIEIIRPFKRNKESIVAGFIETEDYMTLEIPKKKYIDSCGNANLAFRREVLKEIGYYDENLSVAEDYDICFRIREKGYKIFFNKDAKILHPKESFKKNLKKSFIYGKGVVRLYKKHLNKLRLNNHILFTLVYSGYILLLPLTILWLYYPLLILIPILINIKRNPIKILINLSYGLGVLKELFFPKKLN